MKRISKAARFLAYHRLASRISRIASRSKSMVLVISIFQDELHHFISRHGYRFAASIVIDSPLQFVAPIVLIDERRSVIQRVVELIRQFTAVGVRKLQRSVE